LTIGRFVLAAVFLFAGALHFAVPQFYVKIVPLYLPAPLQLVYVSGFFEVLGGLGLLLPVDMLGFPVRRTAAWGLVALLIAVMPANIYMASDPEKFASFPHWALLLRLPLQLPLIWWAWLYSR
jgi:uncharacterized membrane protein